jgi:hypothetical protein
LQYIFILIYLSGVLVKWVWLPWYTYVVMIVMNTIVIWNL